MGSLLVITPAVFGLIFAFFMYKEDQQDSVVQSDESGRRRFADATLGSVDKLQIGSNEEISTKLRQIYRDIQKGPKRF